MPDAPRPYTDIAIIGAGFAGLGMAIALLKSGRTDFLILERAHEVGGTWRDNSYPGSACDVQSRLYSYSFEQNPAWSRLYPTQPELKAYLNRVADAYGLRPHLRFGKTVTQAVFDDAAATWRLTTADDAELDARLVIMATGPLSNPAIPDIPGAEDFQGERFHSAGWNHAYDLAGKRVAVIGTGASAIQFVPQIAESVSQLHVFQRTPPWIAPKPDRPTRIWVRALFSALPFLQNLPRAWTYCQYEARAIGFVVDPKLLERRQTLLLRYLERQVPEPELRDKLTPRYVMGCKRVLISNDYYPALRRPNVELVTEPIARITPDGVLTCDGVHRPVDCIIYGTGFQASEILAEVDIRGAGGRSLRQDWAAGAEAFLGTAVAGYPNLFILVGPNTGLGHNSIIYMIESQIRYVMDALRQLDRRGARRMAVRPAVQDAYNAEVQQRLARTVWNTGGCRSWYLTKDGRNTTLWPSFTFDFRRRTRKVRAQDYEFG